jgi:hypothetical protein
MWANRRGYKKNTGTRDEHPDSCFSHYNQTNHFGIPAFRIGENINQRKFFGRYSRLEFELLP